MRHRLVALCTAGLLACATGTTLVTTAGGAAPRPANAAATPADVVDYLKSLSGSHTITGQHNREPNSQPSKWTAAVHDITGVYPGLWGGDFLFSSDDVSNRQTMIDQAETEWKNGALPALTWHACPPTRGSSCGWDPGTGIQDQLSDDQWSELLTDGSDLNTAWKQRLDEAVPYLRQLRDAGVPVLFRPVHEMNDGWSWWGGRPGENGSSALFRITHDYLADTKGLDNLVWVWNVRTGTRARWPRTTRATRTWTWSRSTPGTPTTLRRGLPGPPVNRRVQADGARGGRQDPSPSDLASQPKWTYFMVWAEYLTDPAYNDDQSVKNTYADPVPCTRGSRPLRLSPAGTRPARRPPTSPPRGSRSGGPGAACVCGGAGARAVRAVAAAKDSRGPVSSH
ncbi:glycosyl hydrolase [Streptomyces sp. M19]